jgi:hypothetical protein
LLVLDRVESEELLDEERLEVPSDRCDRRRSLARFAVERRVTLWRGEVEGGLGLGLASGAGGRWVLGRRGILTDDEEEDPEFDSSVGAAVAGVV